MGKLVEVPRRAIRKVFGSSDAPAAAPAAEPKPVTALPDPEAVKRKGRRDAALRFGQRTGSGRASTILSNEGKLGA